MLRFFVSHDVLKHSVMVIDIVKLIEAANNPPWAMWNDYTRKVLLVEVENRPKDQVVDGLVWQEELINGM